MTSKVNTTNFVQQYKFDLIIIILLSLTLPLFFYKLGQSSLVSFDEAWYAAISRNILHSGNWINLTFNGTKYYDHPPIGFWLTAITFQLFGINEFWARFSQAICGFLSLIALFFLGKVMFNRIVGFASAVALSSSLWFVYRARSDNLDVSLTFFFILTFLLACKAAKNGKFLLPFSLSLSLLFLSKTMVPFTILPALGIIFWKTKVKAKEFIIPVFLFLFIFGGWFISQMIDKDNFVQRYFSIGLPGVQAKTSVVQNFQLMKEYVHDGIGKWFWPGVLGVIVGPLLLQKRFLVLTTFVICFFIPFIFSDKGQIWHLIPLHPFLILAFFGVFWVVGEKLIMITSSLLRKQESIKLPRLFYKLEIRKVVFICIPLIVFSFFISLRQIRQMWYQFIDIPRFISDEAILSKEAGKYTYPFIIDGDFGPTAVFYSDKTVSRYDQHQITYLFEEKGPFLVITNQWRLDAEKINPSLYQILKKDRDKVLLLKK